ncbi:MAG: YARHG domain-containing protein [Flavobacteriaceae bacterium]
MYKNLPFARRGYIFKNAELKDFYENLDWYIPNPNYIPETETLTKHEKNWIEKYK